VRKQSFVVDILQILFIEILTHWWADFPTGYCPIDRRSEVPTI
jgi:hypothetical protein